MSLLFSKVLDSYTFSIIVDENTSFNVSDPKVFQNIYKNMKIKSLELKFTSLVSQGRVARETRGAVDTRFTSVLLTNTTITNDLISFVYRSRLQLLQCNSLLHTYYATGKHCRLCNHPFETVSHVLNGCTKMQTIYQKRHNRIVDILHSKIECVSSKKRVFKDKPLTPSLFHSTNNKNTFVTQCTRPDIVTVDEENKHVIISEVTVPFDGFFIKAFQSKFDKYFPLSQEINALGYRTEIVVLIIGSLGNVHNKFVSGLLKNNINKSEAKYLAKYCSTSAMLGSMFAWKKRCRLS